MEQRSFSYGATVGLLFLCCFVALGQGELTLEALPDVLFVNNSGVHNVELGTVIRAYCTASSSSAPVVMWFKNGSRLLNDSPHIRIRSSTDDTEVTSVLTIDNFRVDDDGSYSCEASDSMTTLSSTTLNLTAIDDNSISLLRNPVDFEIIGGDTVLSPPKTYDSIRDNRTSYTPGTDFETTPYNDLCCQVFRCIAVLPGDQRSAPDIDLLTVTWLKDGQEIVHSADRTEIDNDLRYQSGAGETRYVSKLFLRPFEVSDAGVYQCVYSDFDTDRELVFSSPFRLDSDGAAVGLVAVSPVDIILDPPEKLVIEVESSGGYFRHAWYKNDEEMIPNGDTLFREPNPEKFSEFFQVFVQDPTTSSDQGIYRVELINSSSVALQTQEFIVTPLVSLSVDAFNTITVTVVEGDDVDISCFASANPLPSDIVWSFGGNPTMFAQTNTTENKTAFIASGGTFSFTEGNKTSTLHITATEHPTNNGVYTCSSNNDTATVNDTIIVDVQVPPELNVFSSNSRTFIGQSVTFLCSVSRSVPTDYTIEWTFTDSSGTATTLTEDGELLVITDITEDEFGTYTCNATNVADLSGTAEITIELEEIPEVTTDEVDPAVPGDNVTLNCYATGDTPFTYEWTMQGNTDILNANTSMGALQFLDIQDNQFGTYICTVSNAFGVGANNATIELANAPVAGANESAVFGVGSDLLLVVSFFGLNLELDEITWTQNLSMMLSDGVGGVSITNSDLNTPEATSTLTRPGITGVSFAGLYVATARNRAGSVSTVFTVEITDTPDIQNRPQDYMFDEGSEGVLTCAVTGIPAVTIYWQFEGENITDDASVTITNNFAISQDFILTAGFLTISSIQRSSAGVYTCVGTNGIRPGASINHTVTVKFAPEILQDPTAVDVLVPNPVILTCTAEGEPSPDIVWIKETGSMQMEYSESADEVEINTETFTAMSNSTITINPTDQFVTANYSCVAMNELGNATSQPAQVTVFVAPSVVPAQPLYFAIEFQVQELTCIATGVPAPSISFMRGDVILDRIGNMTSGGNLTERVNLREQSQSVLNSDGLYVVNRTLEILYPVGEDTGQYSCTASTEVLNMTLSSEATFELIVEVTPTIEVFPEDTEVISQQTAMFSCEASGALPPNITWMKSGTTLESGEDILISTDTGVGIRNSTIRVLDTLPNDATAYTCVATTAAGTVNASAELTVIFPPEIITPALDTVISVNEGMTAIFECTATGIPGPNITWYNGSMSSEFNDELDSRVSLGVQTTPEPVSTPNGTIFSVSRELNLSDTRDSDSGIYFCQASNGEENSLTVRTSFELFVGVRLVIISTPEDRTELQGNDAVFTCTATARPRPNITWWRYDVNGSRVQLVNEVNKIVVESSPLFGEERERTSNLTVLDVQPSDAGTYQCQAENEVSIAEENATLTVHVIPEITFPPPNYRYEINQFMNVILLCTAIGIPAPTIQFFLNNTLLDSQFNNRFSLLDPTDITGRGDNVYMVMRQLLISPALDEDSNNYSCVATNENGNELVEFELIVGVSTNSASSEADNSGAIIGGVVAVVFIITTALTVIVIAALALRNRRGIYFTGTQQKRDPDIIFTSTNESYHVVRPDRGGADAEYETMFDLPNLPPATSHSYSRGGADAEYEVMLDLPNLPPVTSHSSQPTAGDPLYEQI